MGRDALSQCHLERKYTTAPSNKLWHLFKEIVASYLVFVFRVLEVKKIEIKYLKYNFALLYQGKALITASNTVRNPERLFFLGKE